MEIYYRKQISWVDFNDSSPKNHERGISMSSEEIVMKTFTEAGIALKAGEVAELSGLDKKEVDKIIKKLKKEERLESPKRCYYVPK